MGTEEFVYDMVKCKMVLLFISCNMFEKNKIRSQLFALTHAETLYFSVFAYTNVFYVIFHVIVFGLVGRSQCFREACLLHFQGCSDKLELRKTIYIYIYIWQRVGLKEKAK
jgi:hypothetical protein